MAEYLQEDEYWTTDKLNVYSTELYDLDDFGEVHYPNGDWEYFSVEFLTWHESGKVTKLLVTVPKEWAEDVKKGIKYTFSDVISVEEV
jgi:hypothetical protein